VTLGEVYVEYTVRFRTPQIQTTPGVRIGRKIAQAGTINIGPSGILTNIANYIGEGATPALLTPGVNNFSVVIPPELNNFLLTLQSYPDASSGNWSSAFSSVLSNPTIDGLPAFAAPNVPGPQMWKVGRPTEFPYAAATMSAKNVLTESYVFYKNPDIEAGTGAYDNLRAAWNNVALFFRSGLVSGSGLWNTQYTITPLATEYPNLALPGWIGLAAGAVSSLQADFKWPTNVAVAPARRALGASAQKVYDDGVNSISYGSTVTEDKRKTV